MRPLLSIELVSPASRNQCSLVAFTLPEQWKHGTGLSIVATHVDSPNLRIRPVSKREKVGYLQVGVETFVVSLVLCWRLLTACVDMGEVSGIHGSIATFQSLVE